LQNKAVVFIAPENAFLDEDLRSHNTWPYSYYLRAHFSLTVSAV